MVFNRDLTQFMNNILSISKLPIVLSGGFGQIKHLKTFKKTFRYAIGSSLYYGKVQITEIKETLKALNFELEVDSIYLSDTGISNFLSVEYAFKELDCHVKKINNFEDVTEDSLLVVPY